MSILTQSALKPLTTKELQVLEWQSHLEWLQRQVREFELAEEMKTIPSTIYKDDQALNDEINQIEERIDRLKKDLAYAAARTTIKDKIIEDVDSAYIILGHLYGKEQDDIEMIKLLEERDSLVTRFLKLNESLRERKSELSAVQKEIIETHKQNRQLMQDITLLKEEQRLPSTGEIQSSQIKSIEKDFATSKSRMEILRNVLQGLIIESGVAWAEDKQLLEIMMLIGE